MSSKNTIQNKAVEILEREPEGLRNTELVESILAELPSANRNTICGTLVGLVRERATEIIKPARGLFLHAQYAEDGTVVSIPDTSPYEEKFHKPFADWLVEILEECTKAISLGRKYFGANMGYA